MNGTDLVLKFVIQPLTNNFGSLFYLSWNQLDLHCSIHHPVGVKLLVSLRLGFSNLHEYKFRNNFPNALKPLRSCSLEPETTSPYLSRCHTFFSACSALMNYPNLISPTIFQNETALSNILLHGHSKKSTWENRKPLQSTIKYVFATKIFAIILLKVSSQWQLKYATPRLNYHKCLNTKWLAYYCSLLLLSLFALEWFLFWEWHNDHQQYFSILW